MLMVLAIHAPHPNHGIGAYSTREQAEEAKSIALLTRPDIPECWYNIYKIQMGQPMVMGIQSLSAL
jgi:hypothetical protein